MKQELDKLLEEMVEVPKYQQELILSVEDEVIFKALDYAGVKISDNIIKCMLTRQSEAYLRMIENGKEIVLQLFKRIFLPSISHAQLCKDLFIAVFVI